MFHFFRRVSAQKFKKHISDCWTGLQRASELKHTSLFDKKLSSVRVLLIGLALIFLWQGSIVLNQDSLSHRHRRHDASGFSHYFGEHFYYFYHHLGLWPVALWSRDGLVMEDSKEHAQKLLQTQNDNLVMERGYWSRLGESGRIFAYLPNAWLRGTATSPSLKVFNVILLWTALVLLWISFWSVGRGLLGAILVFSVGSSPFLLYETLGRENIFAMQSCVVLILLALHIKLLDARKSNWAYICIPCISGLLIGFAYHIRAESLAIIAAPVLTYLLLARGLKRPSRLLFTLVVCLSLILSIKGIDGYFEGKRLESIRVVREAGGVTYDGFTQATHGFWHPLWCGLGDFGQDLGYEWNDIKAYEYALPILKERYNLDIPYPNTNFPLKKRRQYMTDLFYDSTKYYPKKFEDLEEYNLVIKEKVVSDLTSKPLWYLSVLARRVFRVFSKTSPVNWRVGPWRVNIPFIGLLFFPFIYICWRQKRWFEGALVLFALPLCANSIVIFSGNNSTYNGSYHQIVFSILMLWLLDALCRRRAERSRVAS